MDKQSRTPTLPTLGGVLTNVNVDSSFVETSDINDINFISEGFLSRYFYSLGKQKTGTNKKILKALGVVAVLAVAAVATIYTAGAALTVVGPLLGMTFSTTAALGVVGTVAGAAAVASTVTIGVSDVVIKARQKRNAGAVKAVKGRNDEIPKGYERKE